MTEGIYDAERSSRSGSGVRIAIAEASQAGELSLCRHRSGKHCRHCPGGVERAGTCRMSPAEDRRPCWRQGPGVPRSLEAKKEPRTSRSQHRGRSPQAHWYSHFVVPIQ